MLPPRVCANHIVVLCLHRQYSRPFFFFPFSPFFLFFLIATAYACVLKTLAGLQSWKLPVSGRDIAHASTRA